MKKALTLLFFITGIALYGHAQTVGTCQLSQACNNPQEFVVNGDFDSPGGFTTSLTQSCNCGAGPTGTYCIGSEPRDKCNNGNWINDLWDCTQNNSTGNYMIVDGNNNTVGATIWSQNVNVTAGTQYLFSFNVMPTVSISTGNNFTVTLGNQTVLTVTNYNQGLNNWNNFCAFITPGSSGNLPLTITQNGPNVQWSDYGIDCISLTTCCNAINGQILAPPSVCEGHTAPLTAITDAAAPVTYSWSPGGGNTQSISVNPTTTTTYTVTVSDANGCTETFSYTLNVIPAPTVFINTLNSNPPPYCDGDVVTLIAAPSFPVATPVSYSWSPGGQTSNIINASQPPGTTTYTVTMTDGNGCTDQASETVTINPLPNVTSTLNEVVCYDDPLMILQTTNLCSGTSSSPYFSPAGGTLSSQSSGFNSFSINWCPFLGFQWDYFLPSLSNVGTNVINYTYTDNNGCTNRAQGTIEVENDPLVDFFPRTIDLCRISGPVQLAALTSSSNCTYSGPFTSSSGLFDAQAAGPGTYIVSVTCSSPLGGCTASDTALITVIETGKWHQTTSSTSEQDISNEVVTDANGNVYIAGQFREKTTFDDQVNPPYTITSPNASWSSYIVKYNSCGILQWVAHGTQGAVNMGNGVTVDDANGVVYLTGTFDDGMTMTSGQGGSNPCPSAITATTNASFGGYAGYVAQYDMNTGCLNFLEEFNVGGGQFTDSKTITSDENTGAIYVGGQFGPSPGGSTKVFARKYTPTTGSGQSNILGGTVWDIISTNAYGIPRVINDMEYDATYNRLWMTGTFYPQIQFPGGSMITASNTPGSTEAFIAGYVDQGNTFSHVVSRQLGTPQGAGSVGNSVAVNDAGSIYFAGTMTGTVNSPFGIPAGTLTANDTSAYLVGIDFQTFSIWSDLGYVTGGKAYGTGVTATTSGVGFTGHFNNGDMNWNLISGTYPFVGTLGPTFHHSFVGGYSPAGNGIWGNVTTGFPGDKENHFAREIDADEDDHGFIVGTYSHGLNYQSGTPASGTLNATGALLHSYNAFAIRFEQQTGAMQKTASGTSGMDRDGFEAKVFGENQQLSAKSKDEEALKVNLVPNPTSGKITIRAEGKGNSLTECYVKDVRGKLLYAKKATDGRKVDFDLGGQSGGVYFVTVITTSGTKTFKVVKKE